MSPLSVLFFIHVLSKLGKEESSEKTFALGDSLILCNLGHVLSHPRRVRSMVGWECKARCPPLLPNLTVGRRQCEGSPFLFKSGKGGPFLTVVRGNFQLSFLESKNPCPPLSCSFSRGWCVALCGSCREDQSRLYKDACPL